MIVSCTERKPRMLFAGRTRYGLPLDGAAARKFAAVGECVDWHLLARGDSSCTRDRITLLGPSRFRRLDGLLFHLRLVKAIDRAAGRCGASVVVAQDPYVGVAALLARGLRRRNFAVVVEVHGDWRTATRLYGRRNRRLVSPVADRLAATALRRADCTRAVTRYTADLVREVRGSVDAVFPAFPDLEPFTCARRARLPSRPRALFIGVLERYKGIDCLLAAWSAVRARAPEATLHIVGRGTLGPLLEHTATLDPSIRYTPALSRVEIAAALDNATCLVLPSRSEGMGRVVMEAFARGRPVIASDVGGVRELVEHGETGVLVDADDPSSLAAAVSRVLADPALAARLSDGAWAKAPQLALTPAEWVDRMHDLGHIAEERRAGRGACRYAPSRAHAASRPR